MFEEFSAPEINNKENLLQMRLEKARLYPKDAGGLGCAVRMALTLELGRTQVKGCVYGKSLRPAMCDMAVPARRSWGEAFVSRCEGEAWIVLKTLIVWGCESQEIHAKESCRESGAKPREKCVQPTQREGQSHLSPLSQDIEPQDLEFVQLRFSLALGAVFPYSIPFLPSGMVMYILCHCMLETCNLRFDFTRVCS